MKTIVDIGGSKTRFTIMEARLANCTAKQREVIRSEQRKQFIAHKLELQISHSVCAEISAQSMLWAEGKGGRRKPANSVQLKESENHRGRGMPGPHTHALEKPPKYAVSSFMGYLKRKNSLMIYGKYLELKYKYCNSSGAEDTA